jgi:hypothetical protein
MSYRPLTDTLLLTRPKVKFYGAFPAGFLGRARDLLGVGPNDAVLHVCAGKIREYPYRGLGPNDKTVDLDPDTQPDYVLDVRAGLPRRWQLETSNQQRVGEWDAILIDRPYTEADAERYATGKATLPPLNALLRAAFDVVPIGHRVGVLDYQWPHPGTRGIERFVGGVFTGRNARARGYFVFERLT